MIISILFILLTVSLIQFSFQQLIDDSRLLMEPNSNAIIYNTIARYLSVVIVLGSFFIVMLGYAGGKKFLMGMGLLIFIISSYILTFKEKHRHSLIVTNVFIIIIALTKVMYTTTVK